MNLTKRMLTMKAMQEKNSTNGLISERELIILNLLREKGQTNVSEISAAEPSVSYSTISTDITRLWREKKLVQKTIDPANQRVTLVELTEKGRRIAEEMQGQRDVRLKKLYEAMNPNPDEEQIIIGVFDRAASYFDKLLVPDEKDSSV